MSAEVESTETRETIENHVGRLVLDQILDEYNAGEKTLEEAAAHFQQLLREGIN